MPETYFVIKSGEDGLSIRACTQDALRELLNEDFWGTGGRFHERVPEMSKGYFQERDGQEALLIIRGEIIVPKPKTAVQTWDVP